MVNDILYMISAHITESLKAPNYLNKQAEILWGETLFERTGGQHKTKSTGGEDIRSCARGDEEDEIPYLLSLYMLVCMWITRHTHSAVRSCVTSQIFKQRGSKDALMFPQRNRVDTKTGVNFRAGDLSEW